MPRKCTKDVRKKEVKRKLALRLPSNTLQLYRNMRLNRAATCQKETLGLAHAPLQCSHFEEKMQQCHFLETWRRYQMPKSMCGREAVSSQLRCPRPGEATGLKDGWPASESCIMHMPAANMFWAKPSNNPKPHILLDSIDAPPSSGN